jgi:acylphosphatase
VYGGIFAAWMHEKASGVGQAFSLSGFRIGSGKKSDRLEACPTLHYNHAVVETQAKRFFVSGRVQGVGFRFFVERAASRLGVSGFVRNRFDGRVEVHVMGSAEQIDAIREALRQGPRMATVYRVDEEEAEILREFANVFSIEGDE